jgi:hypothetical protein
MSFISPSTRTIIKNELKNKLPKILLYYKNFEDENSPLDLEKTYKNNCLCLWKDIIA